MPPFSATQIALHEVLRQRLAAAGCQHGRFEISAPGACLSFSGQKADGRTLFFWEFSHNFHRLLTDYLAEHYDEQTAQLAIQIDVANAQFHYLYLTKSQPANGLLAVSSPALPPDRTPYGPTLAGRVAARLDQGAPLAHPLRGYGGRGFVRPAGGAYQYGEVWDGEVVPTRTFATWAAFVTWLAAQSDFSLAEPENAGAVGHDNQCITRQRLTKFVQ